MTKTQLEHMVADLAGELHLAMERIASLEARPLPQPCVHYHTVSCPPQPTLGPLRGGIGGGITQPSYTTYDMHRLT